MNERIKTVRKSAGLKQAEFATRIGVKANTVTSYETGLRIPSDVVINSICREFHVRESWLRTGDGPMYTTMDEADELDRIFEEIGASDDELVKAAIRVYWRLDEKEKAAIRKPTSDLVAELDEKKSPGE